MDRHLKIQVQEESLFYECLTLKSFHRNAGKFTIWHGLIYQKTWIFIDILLWTQKMLDNKTVLWVQDLTVNTRGLSVMVEQSTLELMKYSSFVESKSDFQSQILSFRHAKTRVLKECSVPRVTASLCWRLILSSIISSAIHKEHQNCSSSLQCVHTCHKLCRNK